MADHGDGAKPIWMTEIGWSTQSHAAALVQRRRDGRAEAARRLASARRASCAPPTAASRPTRSSASRSGSGMQDIRAGRATRAASGSTGATGKAKPAARAFRRLDRGIRAAARLRRRTSTARRRRSRCSSRATATASAARSRCACARGTTAAAAGIGRIMLAARRRARPLVGRRRAARSTPWWASADWPPGPHTLTFSVRDYAQNQTTVTVARREAAPLNADGGTAHGAGVPMTGQPCEPALPRRPARPARRARRRRRPPAPSRPASTRRSARPSRPRDRASELGAAGSGCGRRGSDARAGPGRAGTPIHRARRTPRSTTPRRAGLRS